MPRDLKINRRDAYILSRLIEEGKFDFFYTMRGRLTPDQRGAIINRVELLQSKLDKHCYYQNRGRQSQKTLAEHAQDIIKEET